MTSPHPAQDCRLTRAALALRPSVWHAALLALAWSCTGAEPPPVPRTTAYALAGIELGQARLLPRSAVSLPQAPLPTARPSTADQPTAASTKHRPVSQGTAAEGWLERGAALPAADPTLVARPISQRRKAIYGTSYLIERLADAAATVASRFPGSVVWAGDLSSVHGGDLKGHKSHNSGRDADLSFFMRDTSGRPAESARFIPIEPSGRTRSGLWFDVERNWVLVEALVADTGTTHVQWIFIADHLRAMLLEHAEALVAQGLASADSVKRAKRVLRQPSKSSPHADHYHVRVYCDLADRLEGCVDDRPRHAWAPDHSEAIKHEVNGLLPFLASAPSDEFRYAVQRLVRIGDKRAVRPLKRLTSHPDPAVRALALDAVDFLNEVRTPAAWRSWRALDGGAGE